MKASTSNPGMFWEEARELFEEIVGWLDSDSICGLEHSEIESKLLSSMLRATETFATRIFR